LPQMNTDEKPMIFIIDAHRLCYSILMSAIGATPSPCRKMARCEGVACFTSQMIFNHRWTQIKKQMIFIGDAHR